VPVALDRRVAYFAEHLSENIAKTDEGYLICRNAVIGRSGYQTYRVSELTDPEHLLDPYGFKPDDELEIWRDPAEVFSAATMASFEGKTLTLTHPAELLQTFNDNRHNQGHVQNVHRGTEALEDGNFPLLADIVVKGPEAIQAIEDGQRELSCGYLYTLAKEGYRWDQRNILGNHVALVPKGRAGSEARINDAAPEPKERAAMKFNLKNLLGMGLKEFAKDAKPEELSEALDALAVEEKPAVTADTKKKKLVRVGKTRTGQDVFEMVALDEAEVVKDDKDTENQAAKDRKALHDALDRQLDAEANKEQQRTEDEEKALSALKDLFTKKGEDAFPDKTEDADPDKEAKDAAEKEAKDAEEKAAKDAEEKKAAEDAAKEEAGDAEIVRPEPVLAASDLPKKAFDEAVKIAVAKSNLTLLKTLKPLIARSNDKVTIQAFDTAIRNVTDILKPAKPGAGSYEMVRAAASKSKATDATKDFKPRVTLQQKEARDADSAYADVMKKQKEKSISLVARR
jgi:hypothetical protein